MADRAEPVRDPVLAAMTDEQEVRIAEAIAALGALALRVDAIGLGRLPHFPVRPAHRPGNHVLEPAEDGCPAARPLAEPEALPPLDRVAAPRANRLSCSCRDRACSSR
jgi:hypothetical protein